MTAATSPAGATGDRDHAALVRVRGLAAGYGGPPVLRDVDFELRAGERLAVLGPNGGGKTTLFRVLQGELRVLSGSAELGRPCGVVPQTERSRLDFPVSALDVALMGTLTTLPWWRRPGRADRARARGVLADVGLEALADTTFGSLSGGQRQRVLVARAIMQDARVILFDEPFTGLDAVSQARLEELLADLAAQGRALLIATHDVRQATAWDRVLCLNGRQIAFGDPTEVLTPEVLAATYGEELIELEPGRAPVLLPPHHHDDGGDGHDHAAGHAPS